MAAFTEMAANYEATVDRELRQFWGVGYREFIERFLAAAGLTGGERLLDIGAGMAVVPTTLLRRPDWRGPLVGLDITPAMLRAARQALTDSGDLPHVSLVCGSGMTLPFRDRAFDAVTCALATHHMDVPVLLAEVQRVLRPGGRLVFADVAQAAFWGSRVGKAALRMLFWFYGRREGAARFAAEMEALPNIRTPEQWRALLTAAGFTGLQTTTLPARRSWYPPGILINAHTTIPGG